LAWSRAARRVDLEIGGFVGGRRRLGRLDLGGHALIRLAVKAEHWRLHVRRELDRALQPGGEPQKDKAADGV
jgi:hypothetical protein